MRHGTSERRWSAAAVASALAVGVAAAPASAGEGQVALVAAKGTGITGETPGATVSLGTEAMLDAQGRVLFSGGFVDASGNALRGPSWFRADAGGSTVRRVVSGFLDVTRPGDPAPAAAGFTLAGYLVRGVVQARLSQAGRLAFRLTVESDAGTRDVFASEAAAGGLRALAAPSTMLPGVGCGLGVLANSGNADSWAIHDGALFLPATYTIDNPVDPTFCPAELANRQAVFLRSEVANFDRVLLEDTGLNAAGELYAGQALAPRSLPDGATVFRATLQNGTDFSQHLVLFDPLRDPGTQFTLLARKDDPAPGTATTISAFNVATVAARAAGDSQPPRAVYALQLATGGYAIYDSATADTNPLLVPGSSAAGSAFVAGLPSEENGVAVAPYSDGVVVVGGVSGGGAAGPDAVGVWRIANTAGAALERVAYPGMRFTDGGKTFTVERFGVVSVNPSGLVALEATYRDVLNSQRSALLIEDPAARGKLVTALIQGDGVVLPKGTGTISRAGAASVASFPTVFGAGQDGLAARFNSRGEVLVRATVTTAAPLPELALYKVSLGDPGGGPKPGASNLKVRAGKGSVRVSGGKGDDGLRVDLLGGGRIRISGTGGTTVNGRDAPIDVNASKSLTINVAGGDDTVEIVGTPCPEPSTDGGCTKSVGRRSVAISTGDGSDSVTVRDASLGRSTRLTMAGKGKNPAVVDTLTLEHVNAGNTSVTLGPGAIEVICTDVDLRKLDVNRRGVVRPDPAPTVRFTAVDSDFDRGLRFFFGNDRADVVFRRVSLGVAAAVRFGNAPDIVTVEDCTGGKLTVRGKGGDDQVTVRGSQLKSVVADLGAGHDEASIEGGAVTVAKMTGGAGNDTLTHSSDLTKTGTTTLLGGSGDDVFRLVSEVVNEFRLVRALILRGGPDTNLLEMQNLRLGDILEREKIATIIDDIDDVVVLAKR